MAVTTEIAATTAASNSSAITLTSGQVMHVFASADLQIGEMVTLEITPNGGTNWFPVVDEKHRGVVLDDTTRNQTVGGPGEYRLAKTATSVSVAVYVDR